MAVIPTDKPWINAYDPQVPHNINFPVHPLQQFLTDSAEKHPNNTAIIMKGHKISYKELDEMTDGVAAALHATGFKQGDRAVVYMPNSPQFVISYYGILKAGGIVISTNPLYTERELTHQLEDCGAETVFVMSLFYETFKNVQHQTNVKRVIVTNIKEYFPFHLRVLFTLAKEKKDGHRVTLRDGDIDFQDFLKLGKKAPKPNVSVSADDIALLQYTGGTTGLSKGAIALHRNMTANVYMMRAWLHDWKEGDEVILTAIPLFHSYGMVMAMHFGLSTGGTLVMIPNPRDINDVLSSIEKYGATIFPGVPAMYNAINNNDDAKAGKYDLSSIRACVSGSAPLLLDTKDQFEKLTGGKLVEGYGMTETHVATHCNPVYGRNIAGSIGLPLPGVECKVVDVEDSSIELGACQIGELMVRTPTLMQGYWNLDEKTRESLDDGWYKTGDIVEMDQSGYFYIRDRKKDMILAGGYNIYPRELEEVFASHPAVVEVAVIGVESDRRGEEPVAYIVKKEGSPLMEDDFVAFGKENLAAYKYPRRIEFLDELPKSGVGKILKRELREMVGQ